MAAGRLFAFLLLIRTKKLKYKLFVTYSNMAGKEELLSKNIKDFYKSAERDMGEKRYNPAISSYFKALAILSDLVILTKEGFIPKNHAERFRILQHKHPEIYRVMDKDFPYYRDSYRIAMTRQTAEAIKNDTKRIAQKIGFKLD